VAYSFNSCSKTRRGTSQGHRQSCVVSDKVVMVRSNDVS